MVAAYAGLFEPSVSSFDLVNPPPSHRDGVPLLNVLRFMDVPQALALLLPREVKLKTDDFEAFAWTGTAAALLGEDGREALRLR